MHSRETIETLNTLIRACRGAEQLCEASVEAAASANLRSVVRFRAADWARQADELQALVLSLGRTPARSASAGSSWLCTWVAVKAALLGVSDVLALDACQHAQLRALHRYDHALSGYLPERIRRTVTLQADRIADRTETMEVLLGQTLVRSPRA